MSLTIGIYDLFAYIIPGLLYLFVINEFLQVMGSAYLALGDFLSLPAGVGLVALALAAVAAHLLGHLLDPLAKRTVDLVTARTKPSEAALTGLRARYPSLDIRFAAKDWSMLFALLLLIPRTPAVPRIAHPILILHISNASLRPVLTNQSCQPSPSLIHRKPALLPRLSDRIPLRNRSL